jgi:hypothetical protein
MCVFVHIPETSFSEVQIFGRLVAGIAVSYLAEGIDIRILC